MRVRCVEAAGASNFIRDSYCRTGHWPGCFTPLTSHQPVMPRPASGRETSSTCRRHPVPEAARLASARPPAVDSPGLLVTREEYVCRVLDECDGGEGARVRVVEHGRAGLLVEEEPQSRGVAREGKGATGPRGSRSDSELGLSR